MTTLVDVDLDFELIVAEEFDDEQMCESVQSRCIHLGPHKAEWWALSPCGSTIALCDWRRRLMRTQGMWWCSGHREEWDQIVWVPIEK